MPARISGCVLSGPSVAPTASCGAASSGVAASAGCQTCSGGGVRRPAPTRSSARGRLGHAVGGLARAAGSGAARACGPASGTPSTWCVWTKASTTTGSNWTPANLRSSASACSLVSGVMRYGRAAVIASNASATWRIRASLRDLVADQPVRVARAVVPLVVVADDRQLGGELRDRGDDLRAEDRVRVHDHPLLAGQAFLLEQDVVRARRSCRRRGAGRPTPGPRARHRETRITRPMSTAISLTRWLCSRRVRVALVDGLGQRADRLREHVAHLDEPLVRQPRRVQRHREQQRSPTTARRR